MNAAPSWNALKLVWFKGKKGEKDMDLEAKKETLLEVGSCRQIKSALPKDTSDSDRQQDLINNNNYLAVFLSSLAFLLTKENRSLLRQTCSSIARGERDRYRTARFMSSRSAGMCG